MVGILSSVLPNMDHVRNVSAIGPVPLFVSMLMAADMSKLKGKRIVVAKLDGISVLHVTHALAKVGCKVIGGASDDTALEALVRREKPDMVLVDVDIQDSLTLEAIADVANRHSAGLVIVTASKLVMTEEEAHARGALGLVEKPYTAQSLVASLECAVEMARE